jgi:hypothetical protein
MPGPTPPGIEGPGHDLGAGMGDRPDLAEVAQAVAERH